MNSEVIEIQMMQHKSSKYNWLKQKFFNFAFME